jgi:hypothetical protein
VVRGKRYTRSFQFLIPHTSWSYRAIVQDRCMVGISNTLQHYNRPLRGLTDGISVDRPIFGSTFCLRSWPLRRYCPITVRLALTGGT